MPVTIVVGGQYGSEGKGKVVHYLGSRMKQPWLVRCGGPNSGHHLTVDGIDRVFRQLPSCLHPAAYYCIPAGAVVEEALLVAEADLLRIPKERIIVDPRAVLVTDADKGVEFSEIQHIGSTCSGNGYALTRRMRRGDDVRLAADSRTIADRCRVQVVATLLHEAIGHREDVLVEGTQGFMLSLLHSPHYPYCTSRDTTAAACASEVGIPVRSVDSVVMVIRTFPIRVGGPSGPLPAEITWEQVAEQGGAPLEEEWTSVTNRLRRVGQFDMAAVRLACQYNKPSALAVMGLDRYDYACRGQKKLTDKAKCFVEYVYIELGIHPSIVGTGPASEDIFSL